MWLPICWFVSEKTIAWSWITIVFSFHWAFYWLFNLFNFHLPFHPFHNTKLFKDPELSGGITFWTQNKPFITYMTWYNMVLHNSFIRPVIRFSKKFNWRGLVACEMDVGCQFSCVFWISLCNYFLWSIYIKTSIPFFIQYVSNFLKTGQSFEVIDENCDFHKWGLRERKQ